MRSPARLVIVFILLVAMCCGAGPALATTQIFGTCNASLSGDPGFEGLYRYDIDITWNIDDPDMSRADVFIELEALDDSCSCVVVRFDQPAGTSGGLNCTSGNCTVNYSG